MEREATPMNNAAETSPQSNHFSLDTSRCPFCHQRDSPSRLSRLDLNDFNNRIWCPRDWNLQDVDPEKMLLDVLGHNTYFRCQARRIDAHGKATTSPQLHNLCHVISITSSRPFLRRQNKVDTAYAFYFADRSPLNDCGLWTLVGINEERTAENGHVLAAIGALERVREKVRRCRQDPFGGGGSVSYDHYQDTF